MTQANFIIGLILAIVLAVVFSLAGNHYIELQHDAARGEQRGQVAVAAQSGLQQGGINEQDAFRVSQGLDLGRITFRYQLDEAIRYEPEVAVRATNAVPVSVRNAYRERRLARERLGCTGEQCQARD